MYVEISRKIMVKLKRGAATRIENCQQNNLCLACLLPLKGRVIRGVHESCRKLLSAEYDDDEQCVAEGRMLEPKPGRKPSNPVTIEARSA